MKIKYIKNISYSYAQYISVIDIDQRVNMREIKEVLIGLRDYNLGNQIYKNIFSLSPLSQRNTKEKSLLKMNLKKWLRTGLSFRYMHASKLIIYVWILICNFKS